MIVAAVVLAVLYLRGVRRLARRGRRWPLSRTAPFLAGTAAIAVAGLLSDSSFVLHMWEHILIGMAAPLLLALGAPVTLALQTAGPGTRRGIRQALHSRPVAVVAHPVVGWLLFGGTIVLVAFSPVLDLAEQHTWFHVVLHGHLLLVGALFLWPLVGIDPIPRRLPYGARLLAVLVAVPFHAFVGVALMSTTTLIAPDAYPSLADQHRAAGMLWASGELFGVALVGIVFAQWLVADRREAARARPGGRLLAVTGVVGAPDPTAATPAPGDATGRRSGPSALSVGVIVWLASELMFFAGLFAAYFTLRSSTARLAARGVELATGRTGIATVILLASSWTMHLAVRAAEREDRRTAVRMLLVTAALAVVFLGNLAWEYAEAPFSISSHAYGSMFFMMTGFHGLHVIGGILLMLGVIGMIGGKGSRAPAGPPAEVCGFYWHFVDVVWIAMFATIYLIR